MRKIRIVNPGPKGKIINEYGEPESPPADWDFLAAGDAAITRKVTSSGTFWRVQIKKGRRTISKGIWAPQQLIKDAQLAVKEMRASEGYEKKRISALKQREKKQAGYEQAFLAAVTNFLHFDPAYRSVEKNISSAVTTHAIPVGSGTVARTAMIPIEERAAKAVIAWMRHQTTAYDNLKIPHIKGERRAVRRMLAAHSVKLLNRYRRGDNIPANCPLKIALERM